jgi:hypothetical protein
MYNILNCQQEDSVLRFTFGTLDFEDRIWHHAVLVHPLTEWFENALRPLARRYGKETTTKQIIDSVADMAERASVPFASVDWLGLALLAVQSYCDAAADLATDASPETEERVSESAVLAEVLAEVSEQSASAINSRFSPGAKAA